MNKKSLQTKLKFSDEVFILFNGVINIFHFNVIVFLYLCFNFSCKYFMNILITKVTLYIFYFQLMYRYVDNS